MNAERRLTLLRSRFDEDSPVAFVFSDPTNIAYLTGFEGVFDGEDAHAAVVTREAAWLFTDSRYGEALTNAAKGTEWHVRVVRENLYITMCGELTGMGVDSIALESSAPHGRFRFVSREFQGNVEAVDQMVEEMRQVKESDEIERITRAQEFADAAFEHALTILRAGVRELDAALDIEFHMRRAGSDGVAFSPIVASGPNSSLPHARASHRVIESGDFVTVDLGARVGGYCSDMTRTVVVGQASERHREIYEVVRAANEAGLSAVRPGLQGSSIDRAARAVIEDAGFGEYFGHGLGHGVGMDVHELPSISPRGTKSVREGAVITIEPGVYVPGFGGVRIEDLVCVGADGAQLLSRSPKDLIEL